MDWMGFMVGHFMAEREGVASPAVRTRLSLVGALLPSPILGALMVHNLARREAENEQPPQAEVLSIERVELPSVTDRSYDSANALLSRMGFRVRRVDAVSLSYAQGAVLAQSPDPGLVPAGSEVTLTVSKGVQVPDVKGMTYEQAMAELREWKLELKELDKSGKAGAEGVVVCQDPTADTYVSPGTVVIVTFGGPGG